MARLPQWGESRAAFLARIAAARAVLKIVLKTKDDPFFLERWITHHARIVGFENLIILDNESADSRVEHIYRTYRRQVPIVRFDGNHNSVHDSRSFPELYEALKASCEFFVFLDTDEFLVHITGDTHSRDRSLLDYLRQHPHASAFPGTWLENVPGSDTRFIVGGSSAEFSDGLAFGKPIVRASAYALGDKFIHNIEAGTRWFRGHIWTHCFILHMKHLNRQQRIDANLNKLIANRVMPPGETLASLLERDLDTTMTGNILTTRLMKELRQLMVRPAPPDLTRIGWLELLGNGVVRYSAARQSNAVHSYLTSSQRLCQEVLHTDLSHFLARTPAQKRRWQQIGNPGRFRESSNQDRWTILFVSHDAARAGAQLVLLEFLSWLKAHTAIRIKILCLEGGDWLPRFRALADTTLLSDLQEQAAQADITGPLLEFCGSPPALIYANTVAVGRMYPVLKRLDCPILMHVHELESSIARYAANWIGPVIEGSSHLVACSPAVRDNLVTAHHASPDQISVVHEFIRPNEQATPLTGPERAALRSRLGLPLDKRLVMGCGVGMPFRKGADLFIGVARLVNQDRRQDALFCWVGQFDSREHDAEHGAWRDVLDSARPEDDQYLTWLGWKDDVQSYLRAADLFLLTSREDPFPLVALEAAACAVPTVCFAEAGGMPDFVQHDAGRVVPFGQVGTMAAAVDELLADDGQREALGARAREKLFADFTVDAGAPRLLATCRRVAGKAPRVSIIVPNYNHARYLPERLSSIFNQTYRDFEVILLDDASTDESMTVLESYRDRADVRLIRNARNSGSPFAQWLRGLDLTRGSIIWIAESDDRCEPEFIECLLRAFDDPAVKLAYTGSQVIDQHGTVVGDYRSNPYLTTLSPTKWMASYQCSAEREINEALGVKNTILSASAVLFRKFDMLPKLRRQLARMRIAGDWYLFTHAIMGGDIAYSARMLNYHRRHDESVVGTLLKRRQAGALFREFHTVQHAIFQNYRLTESFQRKWEQYLVDQWREFFPGRPIADLEPFYPLTRARTRILTSLATAAGGRASRTRAERRRTVPKRSRTTSRAARRTRPICIAGMHRSGTSMVARILNLAGLYLGETEDLMRPVDQNPEGFWENLKFVRLNDELLHAFGGGWDHPPVFPARWSAQPGLAPLRDKAATLVRDFAGRASWGWKDPRNSLTLPFWQAAVPGLKVVLCVRHPVEVVLSLRARNFFSDSLGLYLWQTHNQRVLDASKPADRLVTDYAAYFEDPHAEILRLLEFAELDVSAASRDACAAFIAERLRHHRLTNVHLAAAELAPDLVEVYRRLLVEAGRQQEAQRLAAPRSRSKVRRFGASTSRPAETERRINPLAMDLLRERSDQQASLVEKDAAIAALDAAVESRDEAIREMLGEANALRQQLDEERRRSAEELERQRQQQEEQQAKLTKQLEYAQLQRRLHVLLDEIIPRGATVLMASRGDDALLHLHGRDVSHFPRTSDGTWNGNPASGAEVVEQLDAIRSTTGVYLVLPAPMLWWLDHYIELPKYLGDCSLVRDPQTAFVFELRRR